MIFSQGGRRIVADPTGRAIQVLPGICTQCRVGCRAHPVESESRDGAQDAKMADFETFACNPLLQQGWQ